MNLLEKLGMKVDAKERLVAFIPEYAAYLLTRSLVGKDGRVAYERQKGKEPTVYGVEFGEKVVYKKKMGSKMNKLGARWDYGIFIGVETMSNRFVISTPRGIKFARSIKRLTLDKRWSSDSVSWVKFAPWLSLIHI